MRIFCLLLTILLIVSACSKKVQEKIGIVSPGPNEYLVQRNKTLEMPPHYELPSAAPLDQQNSKTLHPKNLDKLNEGEKALLNEIVVPSAY